MSADYQECFKLPATLRISGLESEQAMHEIIWEGWEGHGGDDDSVEFHTFTPVDKYIGEHWVATELGEHGLDSYVLMKSFDYIMDFDTLSLMNVSEYSLDLVTL